MPDYAGIGLRLRCFASPPASPEPPFWRRKNGGEGGIRTHGAFRHSAFRVRCDRPLCHLSGRRTRESRGHVSKRKQKITARFLPVPATEPVAQPASATQQVPQAAPRTTLLPQLIVGDSTCLAVLAPANAVYRGTPGHPPSPATTRQHRGRVFFGTDPVARAFAFLTKSRRARILYLITRYMEIFGRSAMH
jgi:hypothetical protein